MNARSEFLDRLLAADVGAEALRLGIALQLLILDFFDKELGCYQTEGQLGDRLLQERARLRYGRSFERAREQLVETGVIVQFERGRPGRGHRSFYALAEKPAEERHLRAEEKPADARTIEAEKPAEKPAPERARLTASKTSSTSKEVDTLLAGVGSFGPWQRGEIEAAYRESADGVRSLVAQARQGRNPAALLTHLIRRGEYLNGKASLTPAEHLDRWLHAAGLELDEEAARIVLEDDFKLSGDDLERALDERHALLGDAKAEA